MLFARSFRIAGVAVVLALAAAGCGDDDDAGGSASAAGTNEQSKVCINKYVTVSVVDEEVNGFRDALEEAGIDADVNLQSAEGDAGTNQTISKQFVDDGCDLIVAATTPGAQAAAAATSDIPIVFLGVSNPVDAGLIDDLRAPGGNVTGAADPLPIEAELDAMIEILPDTEKVGLIWTSGDSAGELHVDRARDHIEELGLEPVEAPITSSGDGTQAALSLIERVDAIQLPCDAQTLAAVPAIVAAADREKVPVFGCSGEAVDGGAILAGSYNYVELGELAASLAVKILNGEAEPGELAVAVPEVNGFDLNTTKAKELGLTVPKELLDQAIREV